MFLMAASRSDAQLLFGVTGDLAHKMIFPALYAMVKRGDLKVPIIGLAFPKWSLERLHRRVTWKASLVPDLASSACVKSRQSASLAQLAMRFRFPGTLGLAGSSQDPEFALVGAGQTACRRLESRSLASGAQLGSACSERREGKSPVDDEQFCDFRS